MAKAQRKNDKNDVGAAITKVAQSTVFVNNLPLAVNGSDVASHPKGIPHETAKTANGSTKVFAAGKPVNKTNDADTCGHKRVDGSPDVNVE